MEKRGEWQWYIVALLLALGLLVFGFLLYFLLTGKMNNAIDYILNLFKFGK